MTNSTHLNICSNQIALICYSSYRRAQAEELSQRLQLPLFNKKTRQYALQLNFYDDRVSLYDSQLNTSIEIDFVKGQLAHRRNFGGGRGQAIAKAIGLKSAKFCHVLDATAGLASDAFVLATLGCPLTLVERSPIVFALLENALERASLHSSFQDILQQGFHIINQDANHYIEHQVQTKATPPDVIYLDPMYPQRKKSALVKKEMQILQRLHGADEDAAMLLNSAIAFASKRVVVKRPRQANSISKVVPSTYIESKKTRYDIYVRQKM